jgi:hypothetical protein
MEELRGWFEEVLQGVSEVMWAHIQDERVLEQYVGVPMEWRTLIRRATVAGEIMNGHLPRGPGGAPAGGVPPADRGTRGGALGAL